MRNPIKMTREGIIETVSIKRTTFNQFKIEKRISTNNEMIDIDFEPKLKSAMKQEANKVCHHKVKSIDLTFEQLYVLDSAPGGFTLINQMIAIVKCNDSSL